MKSKKNQVSSIELVTNCVDPVLNDFQLMWIGVFTRVMDFLGISGFFNRMSAAWAALSGSSDDPDGSSSSFMSRIAMPMMLLPMAAIPIGMGIMGLLAFPVLQLSLPVVRRSLSSTAALTSDVLGSEECAERITCTLARAAKRFPYEDWISR